MEPVIYAAPELLRWFGTESQRAKADARRKGAKALVAHRQGIAGQIKEAASAALSLGRGTANELALRGATEEAYVLTSDAVERTGLTTRARVSYADVREIVDVGGDRFALVHEGGKLVIRPAAHLVRGRQRVPVGWLRNGVEVPYTTLVAELAARCGVEVRHE
jgi:predicted sugar kinase